MFTKTHFNCTNASMCNILLKLLSDYSYPKHSKDMLHLIYSLQPQLITWFPSKNHHLLSACTLNSSDSPKVMRWCKSLKSRWWVCGGSFIFDELRLKCAPAWLHLSQPNQLAQPALCPQSRWRDWTQKFRLMNDLKSKLDWLMEKIAQNTELLHHSCSVSLNNDIIFLCSLSLDELNLLLITMICWSVTRSRSAVITVLLPGDAAFGPSGETRSP